MAARSRYAPLALALLLGSGCTRAAAAPATLPTVSVPAPRAQGLSASEPSPSPPPSPWDTLRAASAVYLRDSLDPPCGEGLRAVTLVSGAEAETRRALAADAGCIDRGDDGAAARAFCCPTMLEAPTATRTGQGASCEEVVSAYLAGLPASLPPRPAGSPSAGYYGAILNRGQYLNACAVPNASDVFICAAIRNGVAEGVTVRTHPPSVEVADCVAQQVRRLAFPVKPELDITRTTFTGSQ